METITTLFLRICPRRRVDLLMLPATTCDLFANQYINLGELDMAAPIWKCIRKQVCQTTTITK